MSGQGDLASALSALQRKAWILGGLAGSALVAGFLLQPARAFESYLIAYLFWLAFPLGSLAVVMLHLLTGGAWGAAVRGVLRASMATLPWFALLFVPIALGAGHLYEWTHADLVRQDAILQAKAAYLNLPFFLARAGACFLVWSSLAWILERLSARQEREPTAARAQRLRAVAGPGLALYALCMTFASVDWAMSLEPHWFSTIYGMLFVLGQALTAFAFAIVVAGWLQRREPFSRWLNPGHFHDLGKLMFACVLLWAYLNFSQFLIVWQANLAEETPWYQRRASGGMAVVALLLIGLHFALPFALLLSRKLKRDPRLLARVAAGLLLVRFLDLWWLVAPAFHGRHGFLLAWTDLVAPLALGGLWVGLLMGQLKGRPLIAPEGEPVEAAREQRAQA